MSSDFVSVVSNCFAVGWVSVAAYCVAVKADCAVGVDFVAVDSFAVAADSVVEEADYVGVAADYVAVAAYSVVCFVLVVYFALLVGCLLDWVLLVHSVLLAEQ